jgi:hypothetical protein
VTEEPGANGKKPYELAEPISQKPEVQLAKSALLLFTNYKSFFRSVLAGEFPYRLRPLPFYTVCFAAFALAFPLMPLQQTEPGWFEVCSYLDPDSQAAFIREMELGDVSMDEYFLGETLAPGSTVLSDRVKKKVGSVEAGDVSFHLARHDPALATTFRKIMQKREHVDEYHGFARRFFFPVTVVFFDSLALYLFSRQRRTLKQTFACNLYFQGAWLLPGAAYFVLDHFAHGEALAVVSGLAEIALLVVCLIHGYAIFKFTHGLGLVRQGLAKLFASVALALLGVLFLGPSVDWLSNYLP